MIGITGLLSLIMIRQGPNLAYLAWIIFLIGAALILIQPRYGVYLILFFSLIGDSVLMPWYPFNKGFSSIESIFYLSRGVIFSPLEVYILLTFSTWLVRDLMLRKLKFRTGSLFWPAIIFLGFVIAGLIYGLFSGGNYNIALWQVRPMFYMVAMIVFISNLLEKREHVSNLIWFAMLGLFLKAVAGNVIYFRVFNGTVTNSESFMEHAAAVQMNTIFIFVLAIWLFRGSWTKRLLLPLMIPVVILTYIAAQRRAAMLSLIIALAVLVLFLYKEKRRLFWLIVPPLACLSIIYVVAFWNSSSSLSLPAQAIKSAIAPSKLSVRDQSSDIYRVLENYNLQFTIHQKPITGIGFGQPFYVIVPLPNISWFVNWQYYPHNSIIWIWITTGLGGFLSMLFLVGLAIISGIRIIKQMPAGDMKAIALTATFYIVMHFFFAYVDISWDVESMTYIGAMMGLIGSLEMIVARPIELPKARWHWQLDTFRI
jgi:hypothetical protein